MSINLTQHRKIHAMHSYMYVRFISMDNKTGVFAENSVET